MTKNIFSRAAHCAGQIITGIADRLNGNTARRRALKQRLYVAMLAAEQHRIVAARAVQHRTTGLTKHNALLHWRADFHRHAV
ncbi:MULTISPECIES: hypothetical protein [Aeromonas]|jgi:hypothetical protein|uniref:hypothetical protein n=1 Tax=Aeromonas TaxID=642 RepID=UPI0005A5F3A0|nr:MULTISPECIES: hypothetical protein [Aeromonas]MDF2415463.1 hypothetical protein [Aeromonas sp. 1HA1]